MADETKIGGDNYRFKETLWTTLLKAKDKSSTGYQEALNYLITTYWEPVYFYIRQKECDIETAKDLTQSFFTVFLEKEFIKSVERSKGKFRTFILAALNHFLSKERERIRAQKRGGNRMIFSLDFAQAETEVMQQPTRQMTPEKTLIQAWAHTILKIASENLRQECKDSSREVYLNVLEAYLASQQENQSVSYKDIAEQFHISELDVTNYLHRIRRRYRELIEAEIRKYVADENEVKEELLELFSAFS